MEKNSQRYHLVPFYLSSHVTAPGGWGEGEGARPAGGRGRWALLNSTECYLKDILSRKWDSDPPPPSSLCCGAQFLRRKVERVINYALERTRFHFGRFSEILGGREAFCAECGEEKGFPIRAAEKLLRTSRNLRPSDKNVPTPHSVSAAMKSCVARNLSKSWVLQGYS